MSTYLILAASTFISAIIQATMGFGSALILLNVLPFFFPLNKAIALMQVSMLFLNLVFSIIYWRKIRWDVLYPALIPAAVCGLVFTLWSVTLDIAVLFVALGVVFIVLSIYELALSDRIKVRPSKTMGFLMGSFSGIGNAFFSIAGPPIALYLAPSVDDNLQYFASSQCFFLFCSVPCIFARLISGIYDRGDIPYLAVLIAGFTLGMFFGVRILKKIEIRFLRKLIYAFIGVNGVYIIVRQFL